MKRNIRKTIILTLLAIMLVFTVIGCAEQSSGNGNKKATFDLQNQTVEAQYGSLFKINSVFEDKQGRKHEFDYTVKTKSGQIVTFAGSQLSLTDKDGYVIEYVLEIDGKTVKKTDTINILSSSKPIVLINGAETAVFFGDSYTVPTATAEDFFDGELQTSVEIYKKSADGDVKCEYDGSGTFVATSSGEHYVKATATNSKEQTTEQTLSFFVRSEMQAGELENFDEEQSIWIYQNTQTYNGGGVNKEFKWYSEYKGRTGVYGASLKQHPNSGDPSKLRVLAKGDKDDYKNYKYIAYTMYIEGDEGCTKDFKTTHSNNKKYENNGMLNEIVYNTWKTYYVGVGAIFDGVWNGNQTCGLSVISLKACKIYIDRVYFANDAEFTGSLNEDGNTITPNYTCGDKEISYSVAYNGKAVAVRNGSFTADYVGEYKVYPILAQGDVVYTQDIVYNSQNGTALQVNEYTKVIDPALSYTLPSVKVVDTVGTELEGYTITKSVKSINYIGEVSDTVFDINKGGVYRFDFTAKKDGQKSLTTSITIHSGYAENEFYKIGTSYVLQGLIDTNQPLTSNVIDKSIAPAEFNKDVARMKDSSRTVKSVSLQSRCSVADLQELKTKGYVGLNFSVYIKDDTDYRNCYTNDGLLFRNNNNTNLKFETDVWTEFTVSIDALIAELQESNDGTILLLSKLAQKKQGYEEIYLSDMIFVKQI